jgi:hypothetical protein
MDAFEKYYDHKNAVTPKIYAKVYWKAALEWALSNQDNYIDQFANKGKGTHISAIPSFIIKKELKDE